MSTIEAVWRYIDCPIVPLFMANSVGPLEKTSRRRNRQSGKSFYDKGGGGPAPLSEAKKDPFSAPGLRVFIIIIITK